MECMGYRSRSIFPSCGSLSLGSIVPSSCLRPEVATAALGKAVMEAEMAVAQERLVARSKRHVCSRNESQSHNLSLLRWLDDPQSLPNHLRFGGPGALFGVNALSQRTGSVGSTGVQVGLSIPGACVRVMSHFLGHLKVGLASHWDSRFGACHRSSQTPKNKHTLGPN